MTKPWEVRHIVRGCKFETTTGDLVKFGLEVRSVRSVQNGQNIRVGGRYVHLSGRDSVRIQKEILTLQRLVRAHESRKEA